MSRSRVSTVGKISTASKSKSQRSRNLNRDFSISSRHQCPDQKVSIEIVNSSRSENFGISRQFVSISIFVFSRRDFSICIDFSSFSDSKGLDNVEISRHCLDNLNKNLDVSKSRLKNLNREKKSWSRQFKKVSLDTKDVLDLDWSRLSRPPCLKQILICMKLKYLLTIENFDGDPSFGRDESVLKKFQQFCFFNFQLFSIVGTHLEEVGWRFWVSVEEN